MSQAERTNLVYYTYLTNKSKPMWIDIASTVLVVTLVLGVLVFATRAINGYLNNDATTLQNGYLFVQKGKKPIFFSDHVGANIWIKQCNWAEMFWEVYAICDGEVKHLGNSKDLILSAL